MPRRIEHQIRIFAPAALVWRIVQDPARRPEWDERVRACRALDAEPGPGARVEVEMALGMMPFRSVVQYIAWAPPLKSSVRTVEGALGATVAGSWHFDEAGPGETVWTARISVRCTVPVVGRVLERLLGGFLDRLTPASQANLKRLAEREWQAAALEPAFVLV